MSRQHEAQRGAEVLMRGTDGHDFSVRVDLDGVLIVTSPRPMVLRPIAASSVGGVARDCIGLQVNPEVLRREKR